MAKYFYVSDGNNHLQIDDRTHIPAFLSRVKLNTFRLYSSAGALGNLYTYVYVVELPPNAIFATFSCDGADCSGYIFRTITHKNKIYVTNVGNSPASYAAHIWVNFYSHSVDVPTVGNVGLKIFNEYGDPIFSSLQQQMMCYNVWSKFYEAPAVVYPVTDYDPIYDVYDNLQITGTIPLEIMMNSSCFHVTLTPDTIMVEPIFAHCMSFVNEKIVNIVGEMSAERFGVGVIGADTLGQDFYNLVVGRCQRTQILILGGRE